MSVNQVSKQQIKEVKLALRESLNADDVPQRYTTKELISIYYKDINEIVRRLGLSHAVKVLDNQDIKITANTLKQYLSEIRTTRRRKKSNTQPDNTDETKSVISEQTQALSQVNVIKDTPDDADVSIPSKAEDATSVEAEMDTSVEEAKPVLPGRRSRSRAQPMY